VSYNRLSPFFRAFTAKLSVITISKSVYDALSIPEWRDAVYAEMRALEKKQNLGTSQITWRKKTSGLQVGFYS